MIFGEKVPGLDYRTRKAVYAVIFNSTKNKVAIIRGSRGHYFLPGGGIENNEGHKECLERELLEETGYEIQIGSYLGQAKRYFLSSDNEPMLSEGFFYLACLSNQKQEPIEDDHFLEWVSVANTQELLFHDHQTWAVNKGVGV